MNFKVQRNRENNYEILKQKRIIYSIIIFIVFVLIFLFVWNNRIAPVESSDTTLYMCNRECVHVVGEILSGDEITQEFTTPFSKIKGITVIAATYDRMLLGKLEFILKNSEDEELGSKYVDCEDLIDNTQFSVYFDKSIKTIKNEKYKIVIRGVDTKSGMAPTLYTSDGDWYLDNNLYVNGEQNSNDLAFGIYGDGNINLPYEMYIYIAIAILILLIFILYNFITVKRICIEKIFVVSILFWGILYCILLPPMTAPDEADHFISSYVVSSNLLNEKAMTNGERVLVREQDNRMYDKTVTLQTYEYYYTDFWENGSDTPVKYTDGEVEFREMNGIMYVPQAIGITIARLLKLGYRPMLYMGRAFNLFIYIISVYFAIKLTPVGKQMFFVISHFPMVLELISSYSPDSMLLGMVFLYIAYVLYLLYEKESVKWLDILILFLISIIFIPIKIAYLPLIAICIIIPIEKFSKKRYFVLMLISLCAASVVPMFVSKFNSYMVEVTTDNIIDWSQTEGFIVSDFISAPGHMFNILVNTMIKKSDFYFTGMLGKELGWLNTHMSEQVIFGFFALFLVSLIRQSPEEEYEIKTWKRVWVILVYIGTYVLILIAMLLGWTTKEQDYVEGIQGRYFLPLLPLCILMFRNKIICMKEKNDYIYIIGCTVLSIFAVLCIYLFAMITDPYTMLANR